MNEPRVAYFGKERREEEEYHSTSNRLVRCILAADEIRFRKSLPELVDSIAQEADGKVDRKSVVSGKSVSARVDFGGRRILTNKKQKKHRQKRIIKTKKTQ